MSGIGRTWRRLVRRLGTTKLVLAIVGVVAVMAVIVALVVSSGGSSGSNQAATTTTVPLTARRPGEHRRARGQRHDDPRRVPGRRP